MFFPLLTQEEKENCLSLLICAANCDGEFHMKERDLISGYSLLMGIEPKFTTNQSTNETIQYFSQKSDITKRAVFLETLGLIESDEVYQQEEGEFVNSMAESFGFDSEYIKNARDWIKEMLPLYIRGFNLVGVQT